MVRGGTLIQLGRYDEAEQALDRAAELGRQHRLAAAEIDALSTRANLAKARGDVRGLAADQLGAPRTNPSARKSAVGGNRPGEHGSRTSCLLAMRALRSRRSSGALRRVRKEGAVDGCGGAMALYDLVRAQLSLGDVAAAREAAQEALAWAERTHDLGHRIRARLSEAMVALARRGRAGRGGGCARRGGGSDRSDWQPALDSHRPRDPSRARGASKGKAAERAAALEEAQRLYAERGATGHAERIARTADRSRSVSDELDGRAPLLAERTR